MEKLVEIEGRTIGMKCSAGTVRTYRELFGADLILDMANIEKELTANKTLTPEAGKSAEQIVWAMCREYDKDTPGLLEFLGQFSPYFVYNAIAQAIYMWRDCVKTLNTTKKNKGKQKGSGRLLSFFCARRN